MAGDKKREEPSTGEREGRDNELDFKVYADALKNTEEKEKKEGAAFPGGKPFPVTFTYDDLVDDPPPSKPPLPETEFYAVNDRPVKLVPTPEGGLDVLALNMRTGEFERDMSCLSRCIIPGGDVDRFSDEASFNARVEAVRSEIRSRNGG
jgi:hypothetical protein